MTKKQLYFFLIFSSVLTGLCLLNSPLHIQQVAFNIKKIDAVPQQENPDINRLNVQNDKIQSIIFPQMRIFVKGIQVSSELYYEKKMNFRMLSASSFGKELDVGSNKTHFWFWSRNMKPPALFYSEHDKLSTTNLKTAFHPLWLTETLGVNQIDLTGATIAEYKGKIVVIKQLKNMQGKMVKRVYLIDPKTLSFLGHYVYNLDDSIVVSTEITKFQTINGNVLPKSATTVLHEENLKIRWDFGSPVVNAKIPPKYWVMPNMSNKINLEGYNPPIRAAQVFSK